MCYQLQSSALPAELSRDGRQKSSLIAYLSEKSEQTFSIWIKQNYILAQCLERPYIFELLQVAVDPVAQWIARRTSNPEAVGSSPTGVVSLLKRQIVKEMDMSARYMLNH